MAVLLVACSEGPSTHLTAIAPHPISQIAPSDLVISNLRAAPGSVITVTAYASDEEGTVPTSFMARLAFDTTGLTYAGAVEQGDAIQALNVVHGELRAAGASVGGFGNRALFSARFRVNSTDAIRSLALVSPSADVDPPVLATLIGDASGDGLITAADAQLILMHTAGLTVPPSYSNEQADASSDGNVTALDAQIVLSFLVQLDVANFRIGDNVNAPPITVTSISPARLTPGVTMTITGTGFAAAESDTVLLDGVALPVVAATPTQLTVQVPAALTCRPLYTGVVRVRAAGAGTHTTAQVQAATLEALQPGQSAILTDAATVSCIELSQNTQASYVVTVFNPARSSELTNQVSIKVAGNALYTPPTISSSLAPPVLSKAPAAPVRPLPRRSFAQMAAHLPPQLAKRMTSLRQHEAAHAKMMRQQHALLQRMLARGARPLGGARRISASRLPSGVSGQLYPPITTTVGSISSVKIPSVTFDTFTTLRVRTAYVGSHCIILEDTRGPLSGIIDTTYYKLGSEFDQIVYPMLQANFGNPVLMDASLDANGRIIMLFTPVVEERFPGLAGFVSSCDFFDDSDCIASNKAEIFYATAPTVADTGYGDGTVADWMWKIRAVIPHEAKHITSDAEHLSRIFAAGDGTLEESWLEEGTAQVAAELYGRSIYGTANASWKGNATYANTAYCDIWIEEPKCLDTPLIMYDPFVWLYEFGQDPQGHSFLNDSNDGTIYGSAWSFARWLADTYASNEGAFFKALTQTRTLSGAENVEARTGVAWPQLVGRWSLSLAADDQSQSGAGYGIASWNLPNIFSGMSSDWPGSFDGPWLARSTVNGWAINDARTLLGGSFSLYTLSLGAYVNQTIGIRAEDGTLLPVGKDMGIAILRTN